MISCSFLTVIALQGFFALPCSAQFVLEGGQNIVILWADVFCW